MKRVNLDRAAPSVRRFVEEIGREADGVELELNGKVVCKLIPPQQLTAAEQAALLRRGVELIRQSQRRNRGVPHRVIASEVREAVRAVRKRK